MTPVRHPMRRAFTLLELMLVVIVLALLAALAIPRLIGSEGRRFELALDQLGDLLTMFAQRDALGDKAVAIWADPERSQVRLLVMDIDPAQPDLPADWRADRFVPPVTLPREVVVSEVRIDGDQVGDPAWSITSAPGEDRKLIEITLQSNQRIATLVLAPAAVAPKRIDSTTRSATVRTSIDLDSSGRSREKW